MMFDFGGGFPCKSCGTFFDFVPLSTAESLGLVPASADLSPFAEIRPSDKKAGDPLWDSEGWPRHCSDCKPDGWMFPVYAAGTSFFRD
jgi:hypothetical protein